MAENIESIFEKQKPAADKQSENQPSYPFWYTKAGKSWAGWRKSWGVCGSQKQAGS